MGVKGLTTFLVENKRSITQSTTFHTIQDQDPAQRIPLVIDAWSLIYSLYFNLRWSFGGEHLEYALLLDRCFQAFRAVGLEPIMVFDGTFTFCLVLVSLVLSLASH